MSGPATRLDDDQAPRHLWGLMEEWSRSGPYFRTRRIVARGSRLYDQSHTQLANAKLLGPWTFNYVSLLLASLPSVFLFWVLHVGVDTHDGFVGSGKMLRDTFETVGTPLLALAMPMGLVILSGVAARFSLLSHHRDSQRLQRARLAFLYLWGRSALPWQTLFFFGMTVLWLGATECLGPRDAPWASAVLLAGPICAWVGGLGTLYLWMFKIAGPLMEANGYGGSPDRKRDRITPLRAYRRAMATLAPLGLALVLLATVVVTTATTFSLLIVASRLGVRPAVMRSELSR